MPNDSSTLTDLAARVADGEAVDWDRALRSCRDSTTRGDVLALRRLVDIGSVLHSASGASRRGVRWPMWIAATTIVFAM